MKNTNYVLLIGIHDTGNLNIFTEIYVKMLLTRKIAATNNALKIDFFPINSVQSSIIFSIL